MQRQCGLLVLLSSQAGAFALCGTWLSMVGVQPILLEASVRETHSDILMLLLVDLAPISCS